MICPNCSSAAITEEDRVSVCNDCGTVLEENFINMEEQPFAGDHVGRTFMVHHKVNTWKDAQCIILTPSLAKKRQCSNLLDKKSVSLLWLSSRIYSANC